MCDYSRFGRGVGVGALLRAGVVTPILNAGCAIPATAPEANIRAMVHAARSW
jgi:uroporphyrinogen-III decarboxylase